MPKKIKRYPRWSCLPCGNKHGFKKQKSIPDDLFGECEVCGKNSLVTDPEHFGHFRKWFK
jgi:hypothetical protein